MSGSSTATGRRRRSCRRRPDQARKCTGLKTAAMTDMQNNPRLTDERISALAAERVNRAFGGDAVAELRRDPQFQSIYERMQRLTAYDAESASRDLLADATITVNGNNVNIDLPMTIDGGTHAQRQAIKTAIEKQWTGVFGNYRVTTHVTPGHTNAMTVTDGNIRDYAEAGSNGHYTQAVVTTHDADDTWSASHEAGHLMGLGDKYRDVKAPDGTVTSRPLPGFQDNVMGVRDAHHVTPGQITQMIDSPQNTVKEKHR